MRLQRHTFLNHSSSYYHASHGPHYQIHSGCIKSDLLQKIKRLGWQICLLCLALAVQGNDSIPSRNQVVIPASGFLGDLPKGNMITDAAAQRVEWLFNNTGLVLKSETNLMTSVTVPESARYYLFVRSMGQRGSSFKVAINDQVSDSLFGDQPLGWKKGGSFELTKGVSKLKITRIDPGSVFDVVVLGADSVLDEGSILLHELNPDVKLLKEYRIPVSGTVKFGDVNGDGASDFLVLEPDFSARVFDHSGQELWAWKAPEAYAKERSEFEPPGVIWDFDSDGKSEVVHWRQEGEEECLVISDGLTGRVLRKTAWPTKPLPHVYNNFRLAIGKLTKGRPNEIVVFTDMGGSIRINAFTSNLQSLWEHTEQRKKDHLGHYVYPVDLDGDGVDEVLVGSLLLDAKGREIWNRFALLNDHHDHADSYKFGDVDGDGKKDIVTANSEIGVFVYEAMTGRIIWQNVAEHSQQVQVGHFLIGHKLPQVVIGGRTYGNRQAGEPYLSSQLYWFDHKGELLFKWPGHPLNGNPDFVLGAWKGGNNRQLFWYKFRIDERGRGVLYFPDPVYHMFDFMGRGAEEVITLSRGLLRVYGSASVKYTNRDRKKDAVYLKEQVVNHTHY